MCNHPMSWLGHCGLLLQRLISPSPPTSLQQEAKGQTRQQRGAGRSVKHTRVHTHTQTPSSFEVKEIKEIGKTLRGSFRLRLLFSTSSLFISLSLFSLLCSLHHSVSLLCSVLFITLSLFSAVFSVPLVDCSDGLIVPLVARKLYRGQVLSFSCARASVIMFIY